MSRPKTVKCSKCDKRVKTQHPHVFTDKQDNLYCKECAPTFVLEYTEWINTLKRRTWAELQR